MGRNKGRRACEHYQERLLFDGGTGYLRAGLPEAPVPTSGVVHPPTQNRRNALAEWLCPSVESCKKSGTQNEAQFKYSIIQNCPTHRRTGLIILLGIIVSGAADPEPLILHWYSNRVVTLLCGGDPNDHYLYL